MIMISWLTSLFTVSDEAIELRKEVEDLIRDSKDEFDINIARAKLLIYLDMDGSDIQIYDLLKGRLSLKEKQILSKGK